MRPPVSLAVIREGNEPEYTLVDPNEVKIEQSSNGPKPFLAWRCPHKPRSLDVECIRTESL